MVEISKLQLLGDELLLRRSDGKSYVAIPTQWNRWATKPIPLDDKPEPEPEPNPGGGTPTPPAGGGGGAAWQWPFQYSRYVLSIPEAQYGPRWGRMHWGLDFGGAGIAGQAVPACADGTVVEAAYNPAMGNHVVIDHPGGFRTRSFHFVAFPPVKVGQKVTKGERIGNVGSTGQSTGAHLHWETYENGVHLNPRDFMKHRGIPET